MSSHVEITLSPEVCPGETSVNSRPEIHGGGTISIPAPAQTSLFRDLAHKRRERSDALESLEIQADYDQKPWNLLYKAIIDSLPVSPSSFQLVYPFTSWNWKTQNVGFISAEQYDFCSTVPQWSAIGGYVSGGDRFNQAYEQFLNIIVASTSDPVLERKIQEAGELLTNASNDYTTAINAARSVYDDTTGAASNNPTFTDWLGSREGKGWNAKILAAETKLNQAQAVYNSLVAQADTPGLENAQAQFKNEAFMAKLNNPGLASFPKVPQWSVSQNPSDWVRNIKAGAGPSGATMGFTNRDSQYDFSNTWAGASAEVKQLFWAVRVNGKWEQIKEFDSDQELAVTLEFEAIDQIQIQPADWYNGPFLRSMANGPFTYGYTPDGEGGTKPVFGKKGFIGLLKTGMVVGYKPTFTIVTSQATFSRFQEKFNAATDLRIGPFTFSAEGGARKAGWSSSAAGRSFTGTTTSESPLILGVTIETLPNGTNSIASVERGTAYTFEEHAGDVLAHNVTEAEAQELGARSWKASADASLVQYPLRDIRIVPLFGDTMTAAQGSLTMVNGRVQQLLAVNIQNGLPSVGKDYSVSGELNVESKWLPFKYVLSCRQIIGHNSARFS
jgi:hypothetical protein